MATAPVAGAGGGALPNPNVQVTVNTGQAVGGINALIQRLQAAQNAVQRFNQATSFTKLANVAFANSISKDIIGAFQSLISVGRTAFGVFTAVGAGLQVVFASLIKEIDKLQGFNAIMSVTVKNAEDVGKAFSFVRGISDRLGIDFDGVAGNFAKLLSALPETNDRMAVAERVFTGVAAAARTLHASTQDTSLMFYAVTQIASKGTVSMEELRRQLGEKLPGALQIAANAFGVLPEELEAAIRKGIVNSDKFLRGFGDELIRRFSESAEKASGSVSASINRLKNVWVDFAKAVLDSGAASGIIDLFDAIREKLSDPYIIAAFSEMVRDLSTNLADMVREISAEDLRNGFDTFVRGVQVMTKVVELLIKGLTWIIDNSGKAGAAMGAIGGAAAGAAVGTLAIPFVGPIGPLAGAGIGAVAGGVAGAVGGRALAPNSEDLKRRETMDRNASTSAETQKRYVEEVLKPAFTQIGDQLKVSENKDFQRFFRPDRLNDRSLENVLKILGDTKTYKNLEARKQAVLEYAKYDVQLGPKMTLAEILGAGKGKKGKVDREALKDEATLAKGFGLQPTFYAEWDRLTKLYKAGRINLDELEAAQQRLLSKQPAIKEARKAEADQMADLAEFTSEAIDQTLRYIDERDQLKQSLKEELALSQMRPEDASIESRVFSEQARFKSIGFEMTKAETDELREQLKIIRDINEIQGYKQSLRESGPDRLEPFRKLLQASREMKGNPAENYSRQDERIAMAQSNPDLFAGTTVALEKLYRDFQDTYARIQALRNNDTINDSEANLMRQQAFEAYRQAVIAGQIEISQRNLELGTGTWDDAAIASLGMVQQGFASLAASATQAVGQVFTTLSDGFADAVARTIVFGDSFEEAFHQVALQAVNQLISGLIKMGIQWAVNAALGDSIAAASTAASVAMGATTAAAWAPAAAMVSLASYGANSAPASAGIASTVAVAQALSLGGFSDGGYTGQRGVNQVAGVVHGKEFVMDAENTKRYRPLLEAIHQGKGDQILPGFRSGGYVEQSSFEGLSVKGFKSGGYVGSGGHFDYVAGYKSGGYVEPVRETVAHTESRQTVDRIYTERAAKQSAAQVAPVTNVDVKSPKIINVVDKDLVRDFMTSAEGEDLIVNVIRRNGDSINAR